MNHPYTCKFWYPATATEAGATLVLTMKAPERANSHTLARNQSIARTRAGTTYVYDRGQSLNEMLTLAFTEVPDVERAAFVTFMEAVQWASTKIKYVDYLGVERIVRFATTSLRYIDSGPQKFSAVRTQDDLPNWNFSFDLLDLTNSLIDLEETDSPVATQIALHIANLNDPHNPVTTVTLVNTDGTVNVESINVRDFDAIFWTVLVKLNGRKHISGIMATHDGFSLTDATGTSKTEMLGGEIGTALGITFTVTVSGAGATQQFNLKVATSEVSLVTVKAKRMKL